MTFEEKLRQAEKKGLCKLTCWFTSHSDESIGFELISEHSLDFQPFEAIVIDNTVIQMTSIPVPTTLSAELKTIIDNKLQEMQVEIHQLLERKKEDDG